MNQSNITKTLLILSLLAAFMGFALPATAASTCGNSILEEPDESCDDGNKVGGDGCSDSCQTEEGWVCNLQRLCQGNTIIDDGEACDGTSDCDQCSKIIDLSDTSIEVYKPAGLPVVPVTLDLQTKQKIQLNTTGKETPNNSGFIILNNEDTLPSGEKTRTLEIKLSNETKYIADDDFIGIAFGIQPGDVGNANGTGKPRGLDTSDPANFVLLQWKAKEQFHDFGPCGREKSYAGISLAHIRGEVTWGELWSRPKKHCTDNTNGSFTLLSDPRTNPLAQKPYVLVDKDSGKETFATLRIVYSKTRIQVFVDQLSDRKYEKVIDQPGEFPTHGKIGLFVLAQNAMSFTFLRPTENNISVCRPNRCGDGKIATTTATTGILPDIAEQCDDGNTLPNDGCDPLCQKETCDDKTTGGCKDGEIQKGWACSTKEGGKCFKVTLDTIPHNGEPLKDSDKDKEEKYTYYTNSGEIEIGGSLTGELSEVKVSVQKIDEQGNNFDSAFCTNQITPSSSSVKQWATSTCKLNKSTGTYIVTVTGIAQDGTEQVIKRKVVYDSTAPEVIVEKLTEKGTPNKKLVENTQQEPKVENKPNKIKGNSPDIFFKVTKDDNDTASLKVNIYYAEKDEKDSSKIKYKKKTGKDGKPIKVNQKEIIVIKGEDGKWKLATDNLNLAEDGPYFIEVQGTDYAGNRQDPIGTFVFTVDTKAPTVTVTKLTGPAPSNEELANKTGKKINKKNPVIFFDVQDDGDLGSVKVTIKKDGTPIQKDIPVTKGTDGNWKLKTDNFNLDDGKYTIEVTGTDDVGNSKTNTFAFEVDTTAPEPKLTKKKTNESLRPTLTLKTNPDTKDISNVTFTPKNNEGSPIIGTASRNPDTGKWEVTPDKPLTEGTEYDVAVDAEDNVGNKTTRDAGTITVDQTAPNPAKVKKLTKKGEDTTLTNTSGGTIKEKNPDIFFDVPQEDDTESLKVTITKKDGTKIYDDKTVTKGADGSWKLPTDNLEDGEYTIEVVAVDEAGNKAESQTFELKVEDPNSSGYVLGGCSTTPTTPAEGLLPLLLSALGVGFLRRRKK